VLKLFFIITFSLVTTNAIRGQDVNQTLELANHYQEFGLYETASKYYRRALFFGNDSIKTATYPKIANCLLLSENYAESIFFFGLAANTTLSDSLKFEYTFMRVLAYILLDHHDYAMQNLYGINHQDSDYFTDKYHFYHGIISLNKNEIAKSEQHFIASFSDSTDKQDISNLYRELKVHRPKPATAKFLSIIFPGAGQAYAGDMRGALNSFLLNAGLGTLAVYTAVNYTFLEGASSIMPWLIRYYMGGFGHAQATAIKKQNEKKQQLIQEIILKKK
jgi:tetratricopeptide (TPR) repeat protein